jgi:hypothetical protein
LRKTVPILVSAVVGSTSLGGEFAPERREAGPSRQERNISDLRGARCAAAGSHARIRAVAMDAIGHWSQVAGAGPSRRSRWEARRRALVVLAWMQDRRDRVRFLLGLRNPHALSYREICEEYSSHRFGLS